MTPERFRKIQQVLRRRQTDLTVLAENVHKSHNIAALIRTCDAVGIYRLHAVSAGGEFPRHHMIAAGTNKWVKTEIHDDVRVAVAALKSDGFTVLAAHLSDGAIDYRDIDYTKPTAVLLGSELTGVSSEAAQLADAHVRIPIHGMVDSLNVSVANALILYEAARQREKSGQYERSRLDSKEFRTTLFEWSYPHIAERCRQQGLPYPELDEDGFFHDNPLQKHG